jgi:pimeloyl-ACP methyl ester carboxylesterase
MVIVFVHGAGSNAGFWQRQQGAFSDAHFVDLPGHGVNAAQTPRDIAGYADWVESYVGEAGIADVVLNGHSMGGAVALTLALRHPVWLKALVLTGSGARLPVDARLLELLRSDYPAAVDTIVKESFAATAVPPTYAQKVRLNGTRRQLVRMRPEVALADYEACTHFDVTGRLHEIELPTLCIVGEQDVMTPPHLSRELYEGIHGSRMEIIEGAGHMLPLEQPEEYNRALAAFVDGLLE